MCNFAVDKDEVERRFAVDFDRYFEGRSPRLAEEAAANARQPRRRRGPNCCASPTTGRIFVRNVCMAFDRYLEARQSAGRPVYSRTV